MTTSNQAVGQQEGKAKKELRQSLYSPYLALVSVAGLALVIWGIILFPTYEQPINLLLLALLAVAAQAVTTQTKEGVDFSVTSAISLAAVPLYGPAAAVVVAATGELGLWVVSIRTDRPPWKHALRRLAFNVGMNGLATFCAGLVFVLLQNLLGGGDSFLGQVVPWLPAALVGDQLNLWLLIGVLYLHQGVPPLEIWRESRWAVPINVLTTSVGGGFLALAVDRLGFLGLAIFFLPILLSAYAFRLYVNRTREQMTKLEELVDLRTRALSKVNEELAELHKEKDAFLAVLTHDMRTPLTTIHGYIDLLLHRPDMDRAQQEHILQILKRSERTLIEMVNNILEIRQLQSGAPVILERNNFDLTRLIADIV
ncbi:MAG: HAMP domain-containing histidine kinase, partial [Chloroflexi bacterium]|nr:HAMP domain-containing histidine kinase [Chloroflexota bacterium]MCI0729152.1 HAMP domain-containing histidine kinase [Chloroflexota bacterium]